MEKYKTSQKSLREIRQKIMDYDGNEFDRADRVITYLKARVMRDRAKEIVTDDKHWMSAAE